MARIHKVKDPRFEGLTPKQAMFVIEYCKDFDPRRAAVASGHSADSGYQMKERPEITEAVDRIILTRMEESHIDAEWVLYEAVENHQIARQLGNITASNTALQLIAKHVSVDALAKDRVELSGSVDEEIMERLRRGRRRASGEEDEPVSFM